MRDLFLFDCFGVVVGEVIPAWLKDIAGENAAAGLRPVVSEPAPRNRHTLWHKMHPDGIKITIRDIWNRQRLIYC